MRIPLVVVLLLLPITLWANHSTLRVDPFNTNPVNINGQPSASFGTQLRENLDHEGAQRDGAHSSPFIATGGIHGTSSSLISPAFATEAFVPERVNQVSTAITYAALANDVCWTIISSDNNGITGWTRVGSTSYYYKCEGDTTPDQPSLPPNSANLMLVQISGSAIATVTDLRRLNPYRLPSTEGTLNAAVTAAGSTQTTLVINRQVHVTRNVTVPSTVALVFEGIESRLVATSAVTVTVNGGWQAPLHQVIGSNVTVSFGNAAYAPTLISPAWWGATPDGNVNTGGGTDNGPFINAALGSYAPAVVYGGPRVVLGLGVFRINTTVTIGLGKSLCGTDMNGTVLTVDSTWTSNVINMPGAGQPTTVCRMTIVSQNSAALDVGSIGINNGMNGSFLDHLWVSGFNIGIQITATDVFLTDFAVENNETGIKVTLTDVNILNGTTYKNNSYGIHVENNTGYVNGSGPVIITNVRSNLDRLSGFHINNAQNVILNTCAASVVVDLSTPRLVTAGLAISNNSYRIIVNGFTADRITTSTTASGILVDTGATQIEIVNAQVTRFLDGIRINTTGNVKVIGGTMHYNGNYGIQGIRFNFLSIIGGHYNYNNKFFPASGAAGILVDLSTANTEAIIANNDVSESGGGPQSYGISINANSNTSLVNLIGNIGKNNSVANLLVTGGFPGIVLNTGNQLP